MRQDDQVATFAPDTVSKVSSLDLAGIYIFVIVLGFIACECIANVWFARRLCTM